MSIFARFYAGGGVVATLELPPGGTETGGSMAADDATDNWADKVDDLISHARAAFRAGHSAEAAELLDRAAKIRPDDGDILQALGIALVAAGRAADALSPLRRLVQLRPQDAAAHHQLGDAAAFAAQWSEASQALQKALAFRPDDPDILARLGNVFRA